MHGILIRLWCLPRGLYHLRSPRDPQTRLPSCHSRSDCAEVCLRSNSMRKGAHSGRTIESGSYRISVVHQGRACRVLDGKVTQRRDFALVGVARSKKSCQHSKLENCEPDALRINVAPGCAGMTWRIKCIDGSPRARRFTSSPRRSPRSHLLLTIASLLT